METRKRFRFFSSFLLVLAAGFFTTLSECSFTFRGGILVGHSIHIIRVSEWFECLRECASSDKCVSYNLISARKPRDLICELNDCGFTNNCEVEQNLIKGSGYIFHQLNKIKLEKTCRKKKISNKMPSEERIKMAVSCTERINVYVDEKHLSNEFISCPENSSLTYAIPLNARVIALEGMDSNRGKPGLMASLGNGVITDDSWKCTDVENNDWFKVHYNDSMWPQAVVYGNNSSPMWPLYKVSGILESAKWIWAGNFDVTRHVYCRKNLTEAINMISDRKLMDEKQ